MAQKTCVTIWISKRYSIFLFEHAIFFNRWKDYLKDHMSTMMVTILMTTNKEVWKKKIRYANDKNLSWNERKRMLFPLI